MNMAAFGDSRSDLDQLVERFLGRSPESRWPTGGYEVPTDVFHTEDKLVIRLDLPGVNPDEVEVTVQENVLLINGKRHFLYDADNIRFVRRGTFYGEFTQRGVHSAGRAGQGTRRRRNNGSLRCRCARALHSLCSRGSSQEDPD